MASTYIQRVDSANGNRKVWTWSAWVKRDVLGSVDHNMFSMGEASADEGQFKFSSDQLSFFNDYASSGRVSASQPSRKFRDVNGWYHFVWRHKSDESTVSDRWKIYINGERLDPSDYGNPSIPNEDGCYNKWENKDMWFGARAKAQNDNSYQYFSGLMSHIHFCDGYAYDASDFGSIDNVTGEWSINTSPNVQYGSKGFFILKDGNSVTDQSGNSNNCTVGGGALTKTEDCPSNVFATMNPLNASLNTGRSFGNGNNYVVLGGTARVPEVSTLGMTSGKYYAEAKVKGGSGGNSIFGIVGEVYRDSASRYLGKDTYDYAYVGSDGNKMNNNSSSSYGSSFTTGDIIGIAVDLDNLKIYFSKNGVWQDSGDPTSGATGTGSAFTLASPSSTDDGAYFFACSDDNIYAEQRIAWNFGNGDFSGNVITSAGTNASGNGIFEYDVPTGYTALSTKGLNL